MSYFEATPRDHWRKKRKLEIDPVRAFKSHVKSTETGTSTPQTREPVSNLVPDPTLDLARAEEVFRQFQISSGAEILKSGQGIQTAADEQNVNVAKEELQKPGVNGHDSLAQPQPASTLNSFVDKPGMVKEPFNDPFSSIPGGKPFNPGRFPGG